MLTEPLKQVTTDPESNNRIEEKAGFIASDSLAADSIRESGDFASNQTSAGISNQSSRGFAGKTTDTSSARKITDEETTEGDLDADRKYGKDAGVGPTYNTKDNSTYAQQASDEGDGTNYGGQGGVAPTINQYNVDEKIFKPKGANLKEGGEIRGDEPNESFRAEIGSNNDPGLAAEQKFAKMNANLDNTAGSKGQRDGEARGEGAGYEQLERETEA